VGARKMFLLRRIVGPVAAGKAAPARPGDHTADAVAGLEDVWRRGVADVEVVSDTDAATRLTNRRDTEPLGDNRLRLHFVDLAILADELAGFGPEVLVLSPPELRDAVIERLEKVEAEHG
jgi:proteasome accessory factor B